MESKAVYLPATLPPPPHHSMGGDDIYMNMGALQASAEGPPPPPPPPPSSGGPLRPTPLGADDDVDLDSDASKAANLSKGAMKKSTATKEGEEEDDSGINEHSKLIDDANTAEDEGDIKHISPFGFLVIGISLFFAFYASMLVFVAGRIIKTH